MKAFPPLRPSVIVIDRFYAIVFPMKEALVARKNCFRLIILSWIFPAAVQGYALYKIRIKKEEHFFRCDIADLFSVTYFLFLSLFILTAVILTGLYSTIIIFLYRQQSRLRMANEATKLRAKENRKVTTMLMFLVVPFLLLWVPSFVYNCDTATDCLLSSWAVCFLPLWYTVVNPVVLFVFSKTFRQDCKEIILQLFFTLFQEA